MDVALFPLNSVCRVKWAILAFVDFVRNVLLVVQVPVKNAIQGMILVVWLVESVGTLSSIVLLIDCLENIL